MYVLLLLLTTSLTHQPANIQIKYCVSNICRLGITFLQANVDADVITDSFQVITAYTVASVIQFAMHVMNDMEVINAQQARIMH
jgi:hypothetical protein